VIASATKRRVLHPIQQHVLNPLDKIAFWLGIPPPGDARLEPSPLTVRVDLDPW
jgi:hypothetical protein